MNDSDELVIGEIYSIVFRSLITNTSEVITLGNLYGSLPPEQIYTQTHQGMDAIGMYLGMRDSRSFGLEHEFFLGETKERFVASFYCFTRMDK
jgi:hypothetical protein